MDSKQQDNISNTQNPNLSTEKSGEKKLIKILESYIINYELKSLRGLNVSVGAKNIKGFLANIYGEAPIYVLYHKYGKPTLSRIKDRIKKHKKRVRESKKLIELQEKYPNLRIVESYTYGHIAGKFKLNAEDIDIFMGMLDIALGNTEPKTRERKSSKK